MDTAGISAAEKKSNMKEAKLMKALNSPYIVQYHSTFQERRSIYILMELCEGGDLEKFLEKQKKNLVPEEKIWHLFIQMCKGL